MTKEEAIPILHDMYNYYNDKDIDGYVGFDAENNEALEMAIKALEQEPKTGHWIYKQYDGYPECGDYHCSECDKINNHIPAYCPYCGCAMIEPQESEVDNE